MTTKIVKEPIFLDIKYFWSFNTIFIFTVGFISITLSKISVLAKDKVHNIVKEALEKDG
jgi:hypothetical protein